VVQNIGVSNQTIAGGRDPRPPRIGSPANRWQELVELGYYNITWIQKTVDDSLTRVTTTLLHLECFSDTKLRRKRTRITHQQRYHTTSKRSFINNIILSW